MILEEIFLLESIACAASAAVSAGTTCVYRFRFFFPLPFASFSSVSSPLSPADAAPAPPGGAAATAASFAACVSR